MDKVSEFFGNGRRAIVYLTNEGFRVSFYEGDEMISYRDCIGHSLRYAEDIAENYVEGILQ